LAWLILLSIVLLVTSPFNILPLPNIFTHPIIAPQLNIAIDHIDQDGKIWVTIDGNEYYLYIDDNGTQKRLEMK
jgi:hypothetical protein